MKKKEILGYLQSALVLLLFALMLMLCTVYINLAENFDRNTLPDFPDNAVMLLTKGNVVGENSGQHLVYPYFVGAVSESCMYSPGYMGNSSDEIWECFVEVLQNVPKGSVKKIAFSDSQEKASYLDRLYSAKDTCFYAKLAYPMELLVLCSYVSETNTAFPENPEFVVSDMFLLCGADGESSITAVSAEGDVLKLFPYKNIVFNKELIETYNNTETENFEFIRITENEKNNENGYFPVFKHALEMNTISKAEFMNEYDISGNSGDAEEFYTLFGLNKDTSNSYETSDGSLIFVENASRVQIASDGEIEFLPDARGYELSKYLNYGESTEYAFSDIVNASKNIARGINGKLSAFAGTLRLSKVVYDAGRCGFYYDYYAGGIPIKRDENFGFYLEFSNDALCYAKAYVEPYYYSGVHKTSMPQKIAYYTMEHKLSGIIDYFGAEYSFETDEDGASKGIPDWTAKVRRETE